jgi:Flp pilus assembly protein TadG
MIRRNPRINRRSRRSGAAVVEFAVCLPVILLIVLGSIEAASMLFLRQALVQSAYEGVKIAARNNGDNARATAAVENVAAGRRLKNMSVTFFPENVAAAAQGEMIRVTVSAPGDANSFIPFGPFKDRTVSAQAVMVKE